MMQLGGVGEAVPVFMLDIAAFHSMDEEDSHSMDDDGMTPFCDCEECRERDAALESVRFDCRAHIRVLLNLLTHSEVKMQQSQEANVVHAFNARADVRLSSTWSKFSQCV